METGGREFESPTGRTIIVGWVFSRTRQLVRKILNLFGILSSWWSSNHRPAAPFLYAAAGDVKNCHFDDYYYYWFTPLSVEVSAGAAAWRWSLSAADASSACPSPSSATPSVRPLWRARSPPWRSSKTSGQWRRADGDGPSPLSVRRLSNSGVHTTPSSGVRGRNTFLENITGPQNNARYFLMTTFVEQHVM